MNNPSARPVIILGAGGHAKVIAEALILSGNEILGFVTPEKELRAPFLGINVIGDDSIISTFSPHDVVLANGIGALPYQKLRWNLASRMRKQGYSFMTIVHPSAIISRDAVLAEGVQVMAGSVIQPGTQISRDCIINTGALIDHDCFIEECCHLAPGVVFSGGINVGEGTHIGVGTSVIQNISIGKNSVIAAGSLIFKDVPSEVIFMQKREPIVEKNES